jgi:hypothetical protein
MPLHLLVSQKALQCAEKKTAEPPLLARDAPQRLVFQDMLEKRLGEVLRVVCVVAGAAEVRVNWSPIDSAKLCQRSLRARFGDCSCGDDNAPWRFPESNVCVARRSHCGHARILRKNSLSFKPPVDALASQHVTAARMRTAVIISALDVRVASSGSHGHIDAEK